ncbi:hypothetical protein JDS99_04825 [Bacillus cereus group sp. N6]|uniref:hypothetical protein n=1 Tax=Bacillus cereus group TaxID=86661 RepID=UPI000A209F67|nr:hypothetical protein [Bacillus cereus group sp. N6]ARO21356.1 hypothetical protein B2J90_28460 [Bacillus cereus]MBJ8108988.1 hypothetical protein [Bacillus cereus group sp. N6]
MENILYREQDEKGREFTLSGDIDRLTQRLTPLFNVDPDDEEYGINHVNKDAWGDQRWTAEERQEDEDRFRAILRYMPWDWKDLFDKIPRKKNGTFAKGRVVLVHRGDTYAHYWEDSYGFNGPEVRIKTLDDFTAEVNLDYVTQGY